MKKTLLALLFLGAAFGVFGQRLSSVGILPFEAAEGVSPGEADALARQVAAELGSWGTITVLEGPQAESAEYRIKARVARQGGGFTLTATTTEARSGRVLNESREQGAALNSISMFSFCTQLVQNVPYPNYLLGRWQSTINVSNGPVVCIMEFKSDRTMRVERYDTWEHKQNNFLKYEGYGTGTYSYAGYVRRTITIGGRQTPVDATVGLNVKLEETLSEYAALSQNGIRLLFDDDKNAFELVGASFPCGRNYDGAAVYPASSAAFTRFTKIR